MKQRIAVLSLLLLAGCATGTQRTTWVDPASITDQAAYDRDHEECRAVAVQIFREEQQAQRGAAVATAVVGAAAGAALGSAVAPSGAKGELTRFGAVAGGLSGAGAASSPSTGGVMLHAMRECLRGRGYRPLR